MARILIRDEEAMEQAVAEKTVLLKEVHHRVKNNLQLIASIINMQSRLIDDRDAKRVLRSVQDRWRRWPRSIVTCTRPNNWIRCMPTG
ncbi:sensor histidine kinase [Paracoccus marcusii]|uniref:sensor histidine kinase n=1 Tax=Paracoccus marcusii TaxID=59779 RepID=UPI002ED1D99A|nr:sensor histidine kinase [Paracoccus marcusii]